MGVADGPHMEQTLLSNKKEQVAIFNKAWTVVARPGGVWSQGVTWCGYRVTPLCMWRHYVDDVITYTRDYITSRGEEGR